jgi:hypothetical protein
VNAGRYDWDPTKLSTRVRAAYRFRSGRADERDALPLIAVRFAPQGLDGRNRARAGTTTNVPIWIEKYGDATIRSLAIHASYDSGKTWRGLDVRRHGRDWSTRIPNLRSGFVSLRAQATDSAGNSVRQVIINAYPVKPRR